ncbi:MAG: UDP-N-acetylglucosamine 2-epimerase (non-hydrolyzing) [Candidatus Sumerlaeia bacterium]|nr:UDP-N-acetylglucosamine 2-epimerase (non-hydrolyzing) [Candidatus Sumerlaeia bacterium]
MSGYRRPLFLFGTRPEAIKLAPLILEARRRRGLEPLVAATGQHREMVAQVLAVFGLEPERDLALMRPDQTLPDLTARALLGVGGLLRELRPDCLVVQGDTTTVMAGALAAFYEGVDVVHVEAGLRTDNLRSPYPEEMNRRVVGQLARLHLAPTPRAARALRSEGLERTGARIATTGNSVIDALLLAVERAKSLADPAPEVAEARAWKTAGPARKLVLVTGHRRENFGPAFEEFCLGVRDIADDHPDALVLYPVHLNPNVQEPVRRLLAGRANVRLAPVLDYLNFVAALALADVVVTDSGGVQEEAPALGVPVLVTRDTTERPEALAGGGVELVGPDRARIREGAARWLARTERPAPASPYGDGRAAVRCLDAIQRLPVEEFAPPE